MKGLITELISSGHDVRMWDRHESIEEGELLFILSYLRVLRKDILDLHDHNLVIHASDLPEGKGWSPMAWAIEEGLNNIWFTLFEAVEGADNGPYFSKKCLHLEGIELFDEWKTLQSVTIVEMIREFISSYPDVSFIDQVGKETFLSRRNTNNDKLDISQPFEKLFDKVRVCDPDSYPAWFELRGRKFKLTIRPL